MSANGHEVKRPSSSPGSSFSRNTSHSRTDYEIITNLENSRQQSSPDLPALQKAQTWHVVDNSMFIPKSHSTNRKPSFRIPIQQSSMVMPNFTHALPGGLLTNKKLPNGVAIPHTSMPTILSQFHLTPPAEEVIVSPFEQLLSQHSAASPDHLFSDPFSMSSINSEPSTLTVGLRRGSDDAIDEESQLDLSEITGFAVDQLAKIQMPSAAMSMVHQPLPFPLPQRMLNSGDSAPSLFHELLNGLRSDHRLAATGIRVTHSLVDHLPARNVPTSPPVTPSNLSQNSARQAQGYFTMRPIYVSIAGPQGLASPPGEALVSITERLIPPSQEFELSSFLGGLQSAGISERLAELRQGGLFVLVLPTESGGRTFHKEYLSPLLDPIIRNICTRCDLRTALARDISNAVALNQLNPFEAMQDKIIKVLSNTNDLELATASAPKYELISSFKGNIRLSFEAWFDLWFGQEKARISNLLNYYLNVVGQGASGNHVSRSGIMAELQAEMIKTGTQRGPVEAGIELGVFISQRTK